MEGIDEEDQPCVVDTARAEVEFLQLAERRLVGQDVCEQGHDIVAEEILAADEVCQVALCQCLAQRLEALRTNLIQTDVQVLDSLGVLNSFGEDNHAFVADHVAFDVDGLDRLRGGDAFRQPLNALDAKLVELETESLQLPGEFEQFG